MSDFVSRARARGWVHAWSAWTIEQRTAALASVLLMISTLGSFSFVEGSLVGVAGAVLLLLRARADERSFALPVPDRTLLIAAGAWSAVLIAVRLFDRPLGQSLLAFFCATLLALAGVLDRAEQAAGQRLAPAELRAAERAALAELDAPAEPRLQPEPARPAAAPSARRGPAGVTWLNGGPEPR
jgi:hypothetical protein